jgi:galactokinase
MDILESEIHAKFTALFNKEPLIVRSPGRINLIGEHTDYNDGFVMPAAIDKGVVFALAPSGNDRSIIYSIKYNQQVEVNIDNPEKMREPAWANYLLGVLYKFRQQGYVLKPFYCVFGGDVPMGSGLSSSAAMECGFAFALNELYQLNVPKSEIITTAQWAEHNYVGVKCGIMDQFASVMGKEDHAIVLDCRSMTYHYTPIELKEYVIVLCDTKVKHSLVDSKYNTRRSECEAGVIILRKHYPQVNSLRDATLVMLEKHRDELPANVYNRCLYIIQEISRVQQASEDLTHGRLLEFGKKMYETHYGLSKLYEVSCDELDFLVDEVKKFEAVIGARMMGGGFGGCTINIMHKDSIEKIIAHLKEAYHRAFSITMDTYLVKIRPGTAVISSPSNVTIL